MKATIIDIQTDFLHGSLFGNQKSFSKFIEELKTHKNKLKILENDVN
jgi:hypothetical protein